MPKIIVLDSHIWVWLIHGYFDRFPNHWLDQFQSASLIGISPVSCYEISLAVHKGRLRLSKTLEEWLKTSLEPAGIELMPMNERVAVRAVNLSPIHKDPFDRLIIATALVYQAQLASVDGLFRRYPELNGVLME
ncbi:PIN domain-containing protein [Phormidium yuhuli AB48]|uniref:PIN domain-containing protein n=1 Tax=Phormidium yuhuli AB48 TaxID=2940671 RepID=A0ABY5AQR4_9CYAN|nr:PIN domain-containing protein [Phormidium yuhuli]USR91246.1 PIN domain-containing protein [Phormidium yuhuli AB48]